MYFLCYFLICLSVSQAEQSAQHTAVIFAYGDAKPVKSYPGDPWKNETMWPAELGRVTSIGKRPYHALGKWIGERYIDSEGCDPEQVYARSIDSVPVILSARANLAGMCYQPNLENSFINNFLSYHPLPIHIIPENEDKVLAMAKQCPQYNKLKMDFESSNEFEDRLYNYKGLMDYLTTHTKNDIVDFEDIREIYTVLYIENLLNFTLPKWTEEVFPEKLREPACHSYAVPTSTPQMARLLVGPLMKEIVNNMSTVISNKSETFTISVYTGSDVTVGNVLSALGLFDGHCPSSASTILMELLYDNSTDNFTDNRTDNYTYNSTDNSTVNSTETSTDGYYVRILYRNTTNISEPYVLSIPNCGETCEFKKFITIYDHLISVDWESDCKIKADMFATSTKIHIFLIGFTVVIVFAYFFYFLCCANVIKRPRHNANIMEMISREVDI